MGIKRKDFVVQYNEFTTTYKDNVDYILALDVKAVLEDAGFEFLGWSATEGLFATGAWLQDEETGYVFSLTDAEPFMDKLNGAMFPDPFDCPAHGIDGAVELYVYRGPFKPSEKNYPADNEYAWEMDGSPPSATHEDNEPVLPSMIFRHALDAVTMVEKLLARAGSRTHKPN